MGEFTKYVRASAEGEKPVYNKTSGIKEDVKQIVADVVRMASPRFLRNRQEYLDKREAQSTDSNNRY